MAIAKKGAPAPKQISITSELPQDAAELARKSVDQVQAAFEKANDLAHDHVQLFDAAAGALKANVAELQLKSMEIAQINTNAVFAHVRKLLSASEPGEVLSLNQSFLGEQFQTFLRQASEINDMTLKLAAETAKPVHESVLKSFAEMRKSLAA